MLVRAACLLIVPFLAACSPLHLFDTLVPKDNGVRLVARDQPFAAGERGRLDVYAPTGTQASDRLPVIIFFYGGSWNTGSKEGYGFAGRALASRGFVAVIPDYRLVRHAPFPAFLEDSAAAARWVRANVGRFGGRL